MQSKFLSLLLLALMACLGGSAAHAHDWYIQSSDYNLPGPASTALFMGWGHALPLDDPLDSAKVANLALIAPDGTKQDLALTSGIGYHYTPITLNNAGIWTVSGQSNPGFYTIYRATDGKTHHSVQPLNKLEEVQQVFMSVLAYQYPKTFLAVGNVDDLARPAQVGNRLELVPDNKPGTLHEGDRLEFRAFFEGKPVNEEVTFDATYLGYSMAMEDYLYQKRPLVDGRGSIDLGHSGPWYIRLTLVRPAPAELAEQCHQLYFNTTLVLNVLPRREPQVEHAAH